MLIDLSIIIPSYQRREDLRQVLLSLTSQTLAPDHFEVIVSLDGSSDQSEEMLQSLRTPYSLRWTSGPNAGAGVARNRGAALAEASVLLFLDNDILAAPALAAEHLAGHVGAIKRVCLGQVRTVSDRPLTPWESYLSHRYTEHYQKLADPGYQPDFWDCLSGNFSIGRDIWNASGGFDETFRASRHEDIEFGWRLSALGVEFVYHPDAMGLHHFSRGLESGLNDAYVEGLSARRLANRYPELASHLVDARQGRYPSAFRAIVSVLLANPSWHETLAAAASVLLAAAIRLNFPLWLGRPIYRLAYHLRYWLGVRSEEAAAPSPQHSESLFQEASSA